MRWGTHTAVMAIDIFAAKDLMFVQCMGHDVRAPYDEDKDVTGNSGPGKAFPGAPKCLFCRREVPALITCFSKGSIKSKNLAETFKRIDNLGIYDMYEGSKPMDLFDAHNSRLYPPFLWYVNNPSHL